LAQQQGRSRAHLPLCETVLKLLQCVAAKALAAQEPSHIVFIEALDEVFPDARFWMTHRDIADVVPSSADLYYELARGFFRTTSTSVSRAAQCRYVGTRHAPVDRFRDAGNEHRFFDVHFAPFSEGPLPVIERLYGFIGEDFNRRGACTDGKVARETPREKHGDHRYDPADFGLNVEALPRTSALFDASKSKRRGKRHDNNAGKDGDHDR